MDECLKRAQEGLLEQRERLQKAVRAVRIWTAEQGCSHHPWQCVEGAPEDGFSGGHGVMVGLHGHKGIF